MCFFVCVYNSVVVVGCCSCCFLERGAGKNMKVGFGDVIYLYI